MGGHLNRDGVCMLARKKEEEKKGWGGGGGGESRHESSRRRLKSIKTSHAHVTPHAEESEGATYGQA